MRIILDQNVTADYIYLFPDGASFDVSRHHQWIIVRDETKSWWFNAAHVVAITPGGSDDQTKA